MRRAGQWASGLFLTTAGLVLAVVSLGPLTGAYRLATVLSGSMTPGMPAGSAAVLVPVDPAALRVGDVITFHAPTAERPVVTHRVVEIGEPGPHPVLRTKGDANASADPWEARLTGDRAWRRVAVIPHGGTVFRALRSAPASHFTFRVLPLSLLAWMLASIWWPNRRRTGAVPVAAVVALVAAGPAALAAFTQAASASNSVGSAPDWTGPTISGVTIAKPAGYLAGAIKQGGGYYLYAHVVDNGNPPAGIATVRADLSALTAGQTNVVVTSGPYSVNGVTYNYRSGLLTAANPLPAGSRSSTITAVDQLGHATGQNFTTTVDNIAPFALDVQTANGAGGAPGVAEAGDSVSFTFSEQIDPHSILPGWTGASTNVIVRLRDGGCVLNVLVKVCADDSFEIYSGASPLALGPVDLNDPDYLGGGLLGGVSDAVFGSTGAASTMVQTGSSIVVTLGTRSGSSPGEGGSTTTAWVSGTSPYDAAGNAATGNTRSEQGGSDREF